MRHYANRSGNSGVLAYESGEGWIAVTFVGGRTYRYTEESAGPVAIAEMIRRARAGRGLSSYIAREVQDRYAASSDGPLPKSLAAPRRGKTPPQET